MKSVFFLQHSYEYIKGDLTIGDTKVLGIFSTREKAESAIEFYKTLPGFKDFSDDCFYLDEYELNKKAWDEGFITKVWDEEFITKVREERKKPKTSEEIEYVKNCLKERIREKQEELKKLQEDLNKYEAIEVKIKTEKEKTMIEYYKVAFIYKTRYLYTLWYTNDVDGLLNENGKIKYFNNENELNNYCINKKINIEFDSIEIYNIDKINKIKSDIYVNIDCEYILNLWNITTDIAKTIGATFYGNKKNEIINVYDKIFFGNNLPSVRGDGEEYIPSWNKKEINILIKVLEDCYKIFEQSYGEYE
jgi:hypothetical protein